MAGILLVEDDPAIRTLMRRHLSDTHRISESEDAGKALALAMDIKPDLILLDLNLPDFSGLELCRIFSEFNATRLIPVVVIASEPAPEYREICLSLGAVDYVEKPINFPDLKERILAALQKRRSERRREPRIRLKVRLLLRGSDANGGEWEHPAYTDDVSVSGFSCSHTAQIDVASVVDVSIVSDRVRHVGQARVVRVEHPGTSRQRYGFLFMEKKGIWVLQ